MIIQKLKLATDQRLWPHCDVAKVVDHLRSDEFELKYPELSRAEKVLSRAGPFQFRAETELTICISISSK